MASTDARPVPIKNTAYRVTFPILDADGDLVTGATGLDSEVSKDGGTFADCTNEATEIATSSGMYYLDLTSTEMNADCVAIIVKTSSSGAKTTPIVLYPQESGDILVTVQTVSNDAITAAAIADNAIDLATFAADAKALFGVIAFGTAQSVTGTTIQLASAETFADDELIGATVLIRSASTGAGQSRVITDYVSATDTATVDTWTTTPTGTITYVVFGTAPASTSAPLAVNVTQIGGSAVTASGGIPEVKVQSIAANAITAAATAADFGAEVADAVWDEATSGHSTAGSTGKALTDASSAGDPWSTALPGAYGAGTAGKIIGDNINATISSRASQTSVDTIDDFLDTEIAAILADTNELQTDWANGGRLDLILDARASQTSVDTVDDFLDTEIAAIKAKTDSLTFTVAGQVDANIQSVNDVTVTGNGGTGTEWGP